MDTSVEDEMEGKSMVDVVDTQMRYVLEEVEVWRDKRTAQSVKVGISHNQKEQYQ